MSDTKFNYEKNGKIISNIKILNIKILKLKY